MKSSEEVIEILEAFDLTGALRGAAQLAGCDHKTVAHWVRARDEAGGGLPVSVRPRPRIDAFAEKVEERVDRSRRRVRADVCHQRLVAMGYMGSERTTRRAVADASAGGALSMAAEQPRRVSISAWRTTASSIQPSNCCGSPSSDCRSPDRIAVALEHERQTHRRAILHARGLRQPQRVRLGVPPETCALRSRRRRRRATRVGVVLATAPGAAGPRRMAAVLTASGCRAFGRRCSGASRRSSG